MRSWRHWPVTAVGLAGLLLLTSSGRAHAALEARAGSYEIELATDPAVVPVGKAKVRVRITDTAGTAIEGAQVSVLVRMPSMAMGERAEAAGPLPGQPGSYAAPAQLAMEGDYVATVRIFGPKGTATAKIPMRTGQNTGALAGASGGGKLSFLPLLAWLAGLLVFGFVLIRVAGSGQRPNWGALLNRQVIGGLLLLAGMLGLSIYAVRNFRRPGAMTPLEAQGMEMETPAPPSAAPAELALVQRGRVESTVRYTGSVVALTDQEVYPRVSGWITWMPFYAGDRVKRGQLVAKLDTSQVAPQIAERRAALAMAEQGVRVARTEYRQAEAEVDLAQGEAGSKRGAVAGAQAELAAAREERSGAEADRAAAETGVSDAAAQLQAAQADAEYWSWQIGRTHDLQTAGAVSGEEYRRERAQAESAAAKVRQAELRVDQTRAQVRAAQSRVRKAEAMIAVAKTKVDQMAQELASHHAHVDSAQAAADTARGRIEQAQAAVRQARAALAGAATTRGYSEIRSPVDGVVAQRLISPGVLVNPGHAILRLAQIDRVRLQANVAEADLSRIRIGAAVRVRSQNSSAPSPASLRTCARVTSITPAVDPVARTGVVEAVVPNPDRRFLAGQYVVMEISTGHESGALRVPAAAVLWRVAPSGGVLSTQSTPYVWVAEPAGREGEFTVQAVDVKVGMSDGASTEILSGVREGQQVVTAGQEYLRNGDTVSPQGSGPPDQPAPAPAASAAGHSHSMPGM